MIAEINALAAHAHWVLPGLEEGRLLSGWQEPADIAAFYLNMGVDAVAIKLGPSGAYYRDAHGEGLVPGVPVATVVDTVGAGDGFAVGVVGALVLTRIPMTQRDQQRNDHVPEPHRQH